MRQTVACDAPRAVDHLLLGAAALDDGVAHVERVTGVRPVMGGSHPGKGTRNALAALGARRYLEVIAPDPAQSGPTWLTDLRAFGEPRLFTWAAVTDDIDAVAAAARGAGMRVSGPDEGSRLRPDGRRLAWRMLHVANDLEHGGVLPMPFFIQWADPETAHPGLDAPQGCELLSFVIHHPDASLVTTTLARLGIHIDVRHAPAARFVATVRSPQGMVELV